jgi:hypothetical protein
MRTLMTMTAVVYALGSYLFGGATMAQGGSSGAAKNVVLVHGAFADDSSWSKIVPLKLAAYPQDLAVPPQGRGT